ncbi:HAD family hydrolase [Pseudonocardia sp. RS010]|uniref:HAD family hydrolase n=1 Tax=Pseudonocardia sp. RS010 TaxID=3385979 RepID=UPI0039A02577
MTGVDTVLFDVDGTLVDSRRAILDTYAEALRDVDGPTADPFAAHHPDRLLQIPAHRVFALLSAGDPDRERAIAEAFQTRYAAREPDIGWFPGTVAALRELSGRGLHLGIVTTKARRRLDLHLAAAGVAELFAASVCGDEVELPKPDPAPVLAVLDRIGSSPDRAVLVGDGVADVLAARGAGALSIGVAYGFHPDECRAAGPDHWIENADELPALIGRLSIPEQVR